MIPLLAYWTSDARLVLMPENGSIVFQTGEKVDSGVFVVTDTTYQLFEFRFTYCGTVKGSTTCALQYDMAELRKTIFALMKASYFMLLTDSQQLYFNYYSFEYYGYQICIRDVVALESLQYYWFAVYFEPLTCLYSLAQFSVSAVKSYLGLYLPLEVGPGMNGNGDDNHSVKPVWTMMCQEAKDTETRQKCYAFIEARYREPSVLYVAITVDRLTILYHGYLDNYHTSERRPPDVPHDILQFKPNLAMQELDGKLHIFLPDYVKEMAPERAKLVELQVLLYPEEDATSYTLLASICARDVFINRPLIQMEPQIDELALIRLNVSRNRVVLNYYVYDALLSTSDFSYTLLPSKNSKLVLADTLTYSTNYKRGNAWIFLKLIYANTSITCALTDEHFEGSRAYYYFDDCITSQRITGQQFIGALFTNTTELGVSLVDLAELQSYSANNSMYYNFFAFFAALCVFGMGLVCLDGR